jgi:hypothetical protein
VETAPSQRCVLHIHGAGSALIFDAFSDLLSLSVAPKAFQRPIEQHEERISEVEANTTSQAVAPSIASDRSSLFFLRRSIEGIYYASHLQPGHLERNILAL